MKRHIYGVSIYSYLVIYTGALVRHMKASLICLDWPLCNNSNFTLPNSIYEWVQMGHRTAAGLIFLWIGYCAYLAIKRYKKQKVIYWGWLIAFTLVSLQVISGMLIIFTRLNLYVALAHAFFISCLFGVLSYLILIASRSKKNL